MSLEVKKWRGREKVEEIEKKKKKVELERQYTVHPENIFVPKR